MIHKRTTALERSVEYLPEGLNRFQPALPSRIEMFPNLVSFERLAEPGIALSPSSLSDKTYHKTSLSPIFLSDRSKAVLLLWILYVSCLSCFLVCSLQPCGHLLGKG